MPRRRARTADSYLPSECAAMAVGTRGRPSHPVQVVIKGFVVPGGLVGEGDGAHRWACHAGCMHRLIRRLLGLGPTVAEQHPPRSSIWAGAGSMALPKACGIRVR
jgi:hypothetical protein